MRATSHERLPNIHVRAAGDRASPPKGGIAVILKKGRLMSNGHYLIEVSRSERALFVAAAKMEGTENYLIELTN